MARLAIGSDDWETLQVVGGFANFWRWLIGDLFGIHLFCQHSERGCFWVGLCKASKQQPSCWYKKGLCYTAHVVFHLLLSKVGSSPSLRVLILLFPSQPGPPLDPEGPSALGFTIKPTNRTSTKHPCSANSRTRCQR